MVFNFPVNESIPARRLVHLLIKLGKITKSNQQPRQPPSPSMLPEDREVTDIMTQRNVSLFYTYDFLFFFNYYFYFISLDID